MDRFNSAAQRYRTSRDLDLMTPRTLEVTKLPSVPLSERERLPEISAVYFAYSGVKEVHYIGLSTNIRIRWASHNQLGPLGLIAGVRIAYLECHSSELEDIEADMIDWFDPPLNSLNPANRGERSNLYHLLVREDYAVLQVPTGRHAEEVINFFCWDIAKTAQRIGKEHILVSPLDNSKKRPYNIPATLTKLHPERECREWRPSVNVGSEAIAAPTT